MSFITEVFGQIVILLLSGIIFSFIIWKVKKKKTDFGEFLGRYGEMLAIAGILVIFVIVALIRWWKNS